MTKAEEMRKITDQVNEQKRVDRIAEHSKYANRIINSKIKTVALFGRGSATIKIRKRYSPALLIEQFELKGFEVKRASHNGKTILTIKW